MFYIGNIVVNADLKLSIPRMNVVSDILDIDNNLPTLLIGYYQWKETYELDFIERKVNDSTFWTFTRVEERSLFNKDLYNFIVHCESHLMTSFTYYNIDPFLITKKSLKRILKLLSTNKTVYVVDKNVLFLHSKTVTFGFNLGIGDVIGVNRNKIFNKLSLNKITQLTPERINEITLEMGDIEFDIAQLPYLSEKIPV